MRGAPSFCLPVCLPRQGGPEPLCIWLPGPRAAYSDAASCHKGPEEPWRARPLTAAWPAADMGMAGNRQPPPAPAARSGEAASEAVQGRRSAFAGRAQVPAAPRPSLPLRVRTVDGSLGCKPPARLAPAHRHGAGESHTLSVDAVTIHRLALASTVSSWLLPLSGLKSVSQPRDVPGCSGCQGQGG